MATIRVAIDNIYNYSSDKKTLEAFAEKLRAAGHTVTTHGVGPNTIQGVMRKQSNACDIMIQIAGGRCLGTLCDFYVGVGSYYYAKAAGFAYFNCWDADWPAKREPRDHFSTRAGPVKNEVDRVTGRTLPSIFKEYYPKMYYGYGKTAEDCAKTFLSNMSGSSLGGTDKTEGTGGGGGNALDLIKEVVSDWDEYGPELQLKGDTLYFKRTNPNTATLLNESNLVNNSVTINDFDISTPNSYRSVKDTPLINRFGEIPLDESINSTWEDQVLLMGQRGHGHSLDLKCVFNPKYLAGNWILLDLPSYNINKRPYYITKSSFDEEHQLSITAEPGPPRLYVEKTEVVEEETETTEETTDE